MKKIITILLLAISFTASAQISTLKVSDDAYYTVDQYKTTFHYKYTPDEEMPESIKTNIIGSFGSVEVFADVEIDGEWIILKRIKMEQENNTLSSVKIAMGIEDLFYRKGKQIKSKKLLKSKGIKRWANDLIKLIRQY
jgi:hypothetical protein